MTSRYPEAGPERDRWILGRRPPRNVLDPSRPYATTAEEEISESGEVVPVAVIFLTNRECPWRCLMCDLWKNTLEEPVAPGAIPEQIRASLVALGPTRHVKLYNAGSFFDPKAIPPEDFEQIAALVRPFERVIVESHPALVGEACLRFRDLLDGGLEVAMGLETIHPEILPRLHKRMTLEGFRRAADFLGASGIALRTFVLVGLPFASRVEGLDWACRSIEYAFEAGASVVAIIPTRAGNGALDALVERGEFSEPSLAMLEAAFDFGLGLGRGRVFADLWDLERFRRCTSCFDARARRLTRMNLAQRSLPEVSCAACGGLS